MSSSMHRALWFCWIVFSYLTTSSIAQTWSTCNPLVQGGCSADPALGTSKNIDFTRGASNELTGSGGPTYDSNGAAFTIAKSGDSPTLTSKWYIMFGHVDFVIKVAPGTGIVSSAILQSDCLDEIDWEWLGGDNSQAQSNYFGKGQTVTGYNRGAFHGAPNNHDTFATYSIDWTAERIVWSINGQTVRTLTQSSAEAGQYPQTPMQIRVGAWAGGDPANPQGTIQWAGGLTDYTSGPYTMYLKAMAVTDYSTGNSYSYEGTAGTWQSIKSNGGTVNSSGKSGASIATSVTTALSTASGAPIPFSTDSVASSIYATRTGYPWVITGNPATATTTATPTVTYSSIYGLPSGWTIGADGKTTPLSSSSPSASSVASPSVLASGLEVRTSYDQQGFPTTITIDLATATVPKSYDSQGFEITPTPSTGIGQGTSTTLVTTTLIAAAASNSDTAASMGLTGMRSTSPGTATSQVASATGDRTPQGASVTNQAVTQLPTLLIVFIASLVPVVVFL